MIDAGNAEPRISAWLEQQEAGTRYPDRLLSAAFDQTRELRQVRSRRWTFPRVRSSRSLAAASALMVVLLVAGALGLTFVANQPRPVASPTPSPGPTATPVDLGIFAPAAGRMVINSTDGLYAIDPARADPPIRLTTRKGAPLGFTADGTRLLIQTADGNLSILHADGSETQVTDNLAALTGTLGSGRPAGATISPDGSRVIYAGLTRPDAAFCHDGALFGIDADGGPAEVLWKSQSHNGIVKGPTFSPDGTKIAFIDGYCDNDHSVWVANPDGSDAHKILPESTQLFPDKSDTFGSGLGGGHAYALAWSPTGDRIALAYQGRTFTFASDGSDIVQVGGNGVTGIFWSPDGRKVETTGPWLSSKP